MGVRIFISGNNGDMKIENHQHRIITILDSLKIQFVLVDITAPGMEDQKQFMRAKAKKRNGQRNAMPPQIFNCTEYCGDYEDFDIANEDCVLPQFLGIIISPAKLRTKITMIKPEPRHTSVILELLDSRETSHNREVKVQVIPVDALHFYEDDTPAQSLQHQACVEQQDNLEHVSDYDFTKDIVEVQHNMLEIEMPNTPKARNSTDDEIIQTGSKNTQTTSASLKVRHSEEQEERQDAGKFRLNLSPDHAYNLDTKNISPTCEYKDESPVDIPRQRHGGPISNSIHLMLSVSNMYK